MTHFENLVLEVDELVRGTTLRDPLVASIIRKLAQRLTYTQQSIAISNACAELVDGKGKPVVVIAQRRESPEQTGI